MKKLKHRGDLIKETYERIGATSYLELGLEKSPRAPFKLISSSSKHSVDLNTKTKPTYGLSTDAFFDNLNAGKLNLPSNYKWDIIFIDACHAAEFVYRDLINSLEHLNDDGIIFMHDVLPRSYQYTLERPLGKGHAQDAWKVFHFLLKTMPEVHGCTFRESHGGLGAVIKNPSQTRPLLNKTKNVFYSFRGMNGDTQKMLNEIPQSKFIQWHKKPYYNFN